MSALHDLFTLLVFLLVLVTFYAIRSLSLRRRRAEATQLRMAQLRRQVSTAATPLAPLDESILLAADEHRLGSLPWLGARIQALWESLEVIGWRPTLRLRILLTALASLLGGLVLGRMTPSPMLVTLLGALVLFIAINALAWRAAMQKHLALLASSLPEAIDGITRITRAGVPLHSAFSIAAEHLQGPLVAELRQIDHWLRLGVPIRQAMQDSARRVPLPEYRFFAVILIISQESGGRLGDTLERLTATLRSRAELRMKVMAKTSEARASTKIVAALVPGVLAYMYLSAPDDFQFLLGNATGLKVLAYAACSVTLGLLITHLMVRRVG